MSVIILETTAKTTIKIGRNHDAQSLFQVLRLLGLDGVKYESVTINGETVFLNKLTVHTGDVIELTLADK
ncbi:MAG: hypothetical protein NT098_04795 [Candidatus Parcubacteria bacterium]|nr:hypothetical protein [Candidatus Parcubacteria bacterium]